MQFRKLRSVVEFHIMRIILLLSLVLILAPPAALSQSEAGADTGSLNDKVKKIAILPFKAYVTLSESLMDKLTREEFDMLMLEEGRTVQGAMFKYLDRRDERRDMEIEVKPVDEVNEILDKNEITADIIHKIDPHALCELLGVDVIVYGRFTSNKIMSNGEAIAIGLLVGYLPNNNAGTCKIVVTDVAANKQWIYETPVSSTFGNDIDTIINRIMRKAARQLPSFF
jgi:hypothetical protein